MTPFAGRLPRGPATLAGAADGVPGPARRACFGVYNETPGGTGVYNETPDDTGVCTETPDGAIAGPDDDAPLWSVHMAPASAVLLVEIAAGLDLSGPFWDLTPRRHGGPPRALDPARLLLTRGGIEVVHGDAPPLVPGHAAHGPLLSDPHAVVTGGTSLAFALHDDHAVLFTRAPRVVREAVRAFVGGEVDEQASWRDTPGLLEPLLEPLTRPLATGAWREVALERRPGFWLLHLHAVTTDPHGGTDRVEERRWVGAPGIAWRDGWSW